MKYSPNPVLVEFRDATAPTEWKSRQAKRIYDAAIEAEASGAWFKHVVSGSIKLDIAPPIDGPASPYGTDPETAARRASDYAAKLRAEADRITAVLAAYGGAAYTVERETVHAPKHPFDAEPFICGLLRRDGLRAIWVHGVKFVQDASRSFVRAD